MVRFRLHPILGILILFTLTISTARPTQYLAANDMGFRISQDDGPDIYHWGIEGEPELGQGFDVWANVTDEETSVLNVSVVVSGPNMTLNSLMPFNGTLYTGSVPAFPNDGVFNVLIRAFDTENNSRESYDVDITFEADPVIPIDPWVTMPIVVSSSIGMMALVAGLALVYDRRRNGPTENLA
ncbi:MAG: hypothetical protein ACFFCX_15870 [Candidatus Sifarchaeia archaeon]